MNDPCPLPNFDFRVQYAVASDPGRRTENQDAWQLVPQLALFALADGMGGHSDGGLAARTALDHLVKRLSSSVPAVVGGFARHPRVGARHRVFAILHGAFDEANEAVFKMGERREAPLGMGTTLDAVLLVRDRAFVAHAGDARVYIARPTAFIQTTHDHALHDTLVASGIIAHAPSVVRRRHGSRSPLVKAIGLAPRVAIDTCFFEVRRGDRVLLCTDGVHNELSEEELAELVRGGTAQHAADRIVTTAIDRGGRDNATAIVLEVRDRFVNHLSGDSEVPSGPLATDIEIARQSVLLTGLAEAEVLRLLAASVEIEIACGEQVPRIVASDWVSYVVIHGQIALPSGVVLGPSGLVFPESLVGVGADGPLPIVVESARLLRVRANDFGEVCSTDAELASILYQRLARHIAQTR